MENAPKNLFDDVVLSQGGEREVIENLFQCANVRIERIASHGHSSPESFWYDQAGDEWVMLVRGRATLEYEGKNRVELACGDWLLIPKHVKHRVAAASEDALWLAIHAES